MMSVKLDQVGSRLFRRWLCNSRQASDNVKGQTVVDPKGYLTDLNSVMPKANANIGSEQQ